jgi:hypothetical protein
MEMKIDMSDKLIQNAIQTPDGTILLSEHRNHQIVHEDNNGNSYMVDGGLDYTRYNLVAKAPHIDLCIYEKEDFESIREKLLRKSNGVNLDQPPSWVFLKDMSDDWLLAIPKFYKEMHNPSWLLELFLKLYTKELLFRASKGKEGKSKG